MKITVPLGGGVLGGGAPSGGPLGGGPLGGGALGGGQPPSTLQVASEPGRMSVSLLGAGGQVVFGPVELAGDDEAPAAAVTRQAARGEPDMPWFAVLGVRLQGGEPRVLWVAPCRDEAGVMQCSGPWMNGFWQETLPARSEDAAAAEALWRQQEAAEESAGHGAPAAAADDDDGDLDRTPLAWTRRNVRAPLLQRLVAPGGAGDNAWLGGPAANGAPR